MRKQRLNDRAGAVLLEALVALAVLATVGSAAAWTASESIRAVGRAHEAEARVRLASRLLTAASLWQREDLDRHLGAKTQGPLRMRIDRPRTTLYEVSLMDGVTGRVLLRTSLLRPEPDP
jgi:type II secretory pathway pseudopilin PulG